MKGGDACPAAGMGTASTPSYLPSCKCNLQRQETVRSAAPCDASPSFRTAAPAGPVPVPALALMPPSVSTGLSLGANVGVLAGITAGMEVIKLAVMHLAHRFKIL